MRQFILRTDGNAKQLWGFLRSNWLAMAQSGKPLSVTVEEHKAKRSGAQNRLYWRLLKDISDTAWVDGKQFSKDAWHAWFAGEFIGWEELPGGQRSPISTASLSVPEFTNYIDRVQQHATEQLGVEFHEFV